MKVVYPAGSDNVGDELNAWLWPALLGDLPDSHDDGVLLGIGTLLNRQFCMRVQHARKVSVLGTGAGYGAPPATDTQWSFYAVRGPRTARALGLPAETAVADAAYLLATLDWARWRGQVEGKVVVVPHHRSLRLLDWESVCREAGLVLLSPLLPAEDFMRELASARLVLAEAMHGAILADIVRVPWVAFSFGRQFSEDKWRDWSEAFDLDLQLNPFHGFYDTGCHARDKRPLYHLGHWLKVRACRLGLGKRKWRTLTPPGWPLPQARRALVAGLNTLSRKPGQLTSEAIFHSRVSALYERLNQLRRDLGGADRGPLNGDPQVIFSLNGGRP
jgi:succinoglycan biosynthesis protein ExoV